MSPHAIDLWILQNLYAHRTFEATLVAIGASELGEWYVIGGLMLIAVILLLRLKQFAYAQGIVLSVASATVATIFLKVLVGRARPPIEYWAYHETGNSFPSAHAALSLALFGFLAFMVWRSRLSQKLRLTLAIGCYALIVAIGFTRLYLGVHYFSDVVGGYLLGGVCLWVAMWATRMLEKKHSSA